MDLSDLSEAEDVVIETGGAMGLPLKTIVYIHKIYIYMYVIYILSIYP